MTKSGRRVRAGLERQTDDGFEPVEELRLPPGGRAELVVRLTVRTDGPGTFRQTVSFLTNDPAHPEGRIALVFRTASGGIRTHPTAVQFGRVPVGRGERQVVEVRDRDQPPQNVARVVSADPARVAVRWVSATTAERDDAGLLLGQVEVVPNTAQPLLLDTTVTVEFADPKSQPITIPVRGQVAPRIEAIPGSLILPLSSGGGPVYTGKCLVRGPDGRPPKLEVVFASPGLNVELPASSVGVNSVVQITWVPDTGEGRGVSRKTVRLRATTGEESEAIEIPVTCEHP